MWTPAAADRRCPAHSGVQRAGELAQFARHHGYRLDGLVGRQHGYRVAATGFCRAPAEHMRGT